MKMKWHRSVKGQLPGFSRWKVSIFLLLTLLLSPSCTIQAEKEKPCNEQSRAAPRQTAAVEPQKDRGHRTPPSV